MTNGETPLHRASEYGDHRLVNLLLGHGASVHAENGKGRTAFQVASERGRGEITKLLSEHHGTKGKLL
ncbi:hypothetical protein BJV74DRAFT_820886 [Russula compacta]|nr:hypothetical protein BJV74DRAFT_820886 [Russula compacta]